MPVFEFEGKRPDIHPDAWIAPTATVIGDVTIEAGASVWYGAVLRGDICSIVVRAGANVQDNSVVHGGPDSQVEIGANSTIAHSCVFHGTSLGAGSLIGNAVTVLDDATIGSGTLVAAGSVVSQGSAIPDGVLALGVPAVVKKPLGGTAEFLVQVNGPYYAELAVRHAVGTVPVS